MTKLNRQDTIIRETIIEMLVDWDNLSPIKRAKVETAIIALAAASTTS